MTRQVFTSTIHMHTQLYTEWGDGDVDGGTTIPTPTRSLSCSFHPKKSALTAAISWLLNLHEWSLVPIIRDCMFLVQAISNPSSPDPSIHSIQYSILAFPPSKQLQVIRVPDHCNLPGNDLADEKAKICSPLPQSYSQLDHLTRKTIIHRGCRPPSPKTPLSFQLTQSP